MLDNEVLTKNDKRKAIYKSRFKTFKFLKDLDMLNSELIVILNKFYKKILRNPDVYWEEIRELETILSEKFNPDFSQTVIVEVDIEVAKICVEISKNYFVEKLLQWDRLKNLFLCVAAITLSFLIRPFSAFAGQDSPGESIKKVVPPALTPYAMRTSSHQTDVSHNLSAIDAKETDIKVSVTDSSPQNLLKKKHSDFISSYFDKENVQEKFGSIISGSNLNLSSTSASASQKITQRQSFPPPQNPSSNFSGASSPNINVRLKGVNPFSRKLMVKAKMGRRIVKSIAEYSWGEFLSDVVKLSLETHPVMKDIQQQIVCKHFTESTTSTELIKETPEYKKRCYEEAVLDTFEKKQKESLTGRPFTSDYSQIHRDLKKRTTIEDIESFLAHRPEGPPVYRSEFYYQRRNRQGG